MSFSINFFPIDSARLVASAGSGDIELVARVSEHFNEEHSAWGSDEGTLESAKQIAMDVITMGFPSKTEASESYEHLLAAECLANLFQTEELVEGSDWRWSAFYDTLHTVSGFEEPIQEIVDILDEGQPWFGRTHNSEMYYGALTPEQCSQIHAQCVKHLAEFQAHDDARYCINEMLALFESGSKLCGKLFFVMC